MLTPEIEPPAQYHGDEYEEPEYPILRFLASAQTGDVMLMREPTGICYRATVKHVDPFAVVVSVRTSPAEPVQRPFALNGFELGAYPAAQLLEMPRDRAEKLRKREFYFRLIAYMMQHGEDSFPSDVVESILHAGNLHRQREATMLELGIARLEQGILNPQPDSSQLYRNMVAVRRRSPRSQPAPDTNSVPSLPFDYQKED